MKKQIVKQLLRECWSLASSSLYTEENPARGQCSVTALVIQDCYGGELCKTKVGEYWHFYNCIDGVYYDFTAEQFVFSIKYLNLATTREEAFADTNALQYAYLSNAFQQCLVKQN